MKKGENREKYFTKSRIYVLISLGMYVSFVEIHKNTSDSLLMIGCFGYLRYWGISDIIDVR